MVTESSGKPVLELSMPGDNKEQFNPSRVAALPEGQALVVYDESKVLKIDNQGHTTQELYNCDECYTISGLLGLGSNIYVVHSDGIINEIELSTWQEIEKFGTPGDIEVYHYGSLSSDPQNIPNTDILLLADAYEPAIFSYNVASESKQVLASGLNYPTSVSYMFIGNSTFYVVCDSGNNRVVVYSSSWDIVSSFGEDALSLPMAAIVLPDNSIIVSDTKNNRVSLFTKDGDFISHLLTESDGILKPEALSYFEPHLWVVHSGGLNRYRLDEW